MGEKFPLLKMLDILAKAGGRDSIETFGCPGDIIIVIGLF